MTQSHPYGDEAAERARAITMRSRAILRQHTGRRAPWAPVGAAAVMVLGFWSWVAYPVLNVPYTVAGWDTSLRYEGVAVVLVLAGAALLVWRRSLLAAIVAVLAGVALIASGVWGPHVVERTAVNEVVTGIAVICAAMVARSSRGAARG